MSRMRFQLEREDAESLSRLADIFREVCVPFTSPDSRYKPDRSCLPKIAEFELGQYPPVIRRANLVGLFHYCSVMIRDPKLSAAEREKFSALYQQIIPDIEALCPEPELRQDSHGLFVDLVTHAYPDLAEAFQGQLARYKADDNSANRLAGYTLLAATKVRQDYEIALSPVAAS